MSSDLRSASSSGTPSSSISGSVARRERSIMTSGVGPRSAELQQRQLRAEAGAESAQHAPLARARTMAAQDLIEDEEDRDRAHVAVLGQHRLGGGQVLRAEAELLAHDLDDPPAPGMQDPARHVLAAQAARAEEPLDDVHHVAAH